MAYIIDADVSRDKLAAQFVSSFSTYHTLLDNHINAIAIGEQVDTDSISVDGSRRVTSEFLLRYGVAWFCKELFKDKIGVNNNTVNDEEKYAFKYNLYNKEVEQMEGKITKAILIDEVASRMSTSSSRQLYRG